MASRSRLDSVFALRSANSYSPVSEGSNRSGPAHPLSPSQTLPRVGLPAKCGQFFGRRLPESSFQAGHRAVWRLNGNQLDARDPAGRNLTVQRHEDESDVVNCFVLDAL
jgi:hypothetical protein